MHKFLSYICELKVPGLMKWNSRDLRSTVGLQDWRPESFIIALCHSSSSVANNSDFFRNATWVQKTLNSESESSTCIDNCTGDCGHFIDYVLLSVYWSDTTSETSLC